MQKNKAQQAKHQRKKNQATTKSSVAATGGRSLSLLQRVQHDPGSLSTKDMMALQNTIGNQAVQRLLAQRQADHETSTHDSSVVNMQAGNLQQNTLQRVNFLYGRSVASKYDKEDTKSGGTVDYYEEGSDERENTRVGIKSNGKLERAGGARAGDLVDTSASETHWSGKGWEVFVMSSTGTIYMSHHEVDKTHHSSMLAGGDVAAAGEMKVTDGDIKELNCKSGHYQPSYDHMNQVLHILQKSGNDLNFTLDLTLIGPIKENAKDYWERKGLGKESYEGRKTLQTWEHCVEMFRKKGADGTKVVTAAFVKKKWKVITTPVGHTPAGVFEKPDGEAATPKEVREFLKDNILTKTEGGISAFFKYLFKGKIGTAFSRLFKKKKIKTKASPNVGWA